MYARTLAAGLVAVLLHLALAPSAPAQTPWRYVGAPDGGQIYTLARSMDGDAFALATSGIYRSTDDGQSWSRLSVELNNVARCIVGGGRFPLLLVTDSSTIYRSDDRGDSWTRLATVPFYNRKQIVIDSSGAVFGVRRNGTITRSVDTGATWEDMRQPTSSAGLVLQVAPDGSVYAAFNADSTVNQDQIIRSTDRGVTWTGLRSSTFPTPPTRFAIASDGTMYIGRSSFGLFRSGDHGATWERLAADAPALPILDLDVGPGGRVAAVAYRVAMLSPDGGRTWTIDSIGDDRSTVTSVVAGRGAPLVGTSSGVFRSFGSEGWLWSSRGIAGYLAALMAGPDGMLYGIEGNRLFRSTDGGAGWEHLRPLYGNVAVSTSGAILAVRYTSQPGLDRSTDNGITWSGRATDVNSFARILAAGPDGAIYGVGGIGLIRSTDDGLSWTTLAEIPSEEQATALCVAGGRAYYGNEKGRVIVFDAATGSLIRASMPSEQRVVSRIIRSPGGTLIVHSSAVGLLRSTDDGASWRSCGDSALWALKISDIAYDSTGRLYAVHLDSGVYVSRDDGATWRADNDGIPRSGFTAQMQPYNAYAAVCDRDGAMYVGTARGVFTRGAPASAPSARDDAAASPADAPLLRLRPNPASSSTMLHLELEREASVSVTVCDLLGTAALPATVRRLPAGAHELPVDISMLSPGIYVCIVTSGDAVRIARLVVAR